jgi:hypothetical protein
MKFMKKIKIVVCSLKVGRVNGVFKKEQAQGIMEI